MTDERITTVDVDGWVVKLRVPEKVSSAPVVLLLHGWTGDENSMWVFSSNLPGKALLVSPRGLFPSRHQERAGCSWVEDTAQKWVGKAAFEYSTARLENLISRLSALYPADFDRLNLVGFSQGAAFAATYLLEHPEHIERLALLSGFLPSDVSPGEADLTGTSIFIGHGSLDEIVPPERAEAARLFFEAAGAEVDFCLTEVGHRLGADCFKGFNRFFQNL